MITVGHGTTLFIGGARSGKSDLAVRLAQQWPAAVTFVATARAGDDDMATRIARHKDDRPEDWALVENELFDADALGAIDASSLVIIDCLTLLVANQLFAEIDDEQIVASGVAMTRAARERSGPTLIVTNEVGMGIHPETELGRRYRDLLGRVNRAVAAEADRSFLIVAGRALALAEVDLSW